MREDGPWRSTLHRDHLGLSPLHRYSRGLSTQSKLPIVLSALKIWSIVELNKLSARLFPPA